MGDIYLKVPLSSINEDNYKNFEFNNIDADDARELDNHPEVRKLVLLSDLSPSAQHHLHRYGNGLSMEDCISILKNSRRAWDNFHNLHQFSAEVLLEFGSKFELYNIEHQVNITPEFVEKYHDEMDISSFFSVRDNRGDIDKFLTVPVIAKRFYRNKINSDMSRLAVETAMQTILPNVEVSRITELLDSIYNVQIDNDLAIKHYTEDRDNSSYSVESVSNYYTREQREFPVYPNWEAYVAGAKENDRSALVSIWFNDHLLPRIIKFITENLN